MERKTRYHMDKASGVEVTVKNVTEDSFETTIAIPIRILFCDEQKITNMHFSIDIIRKALPEELLEDKIVIVIERDYERGCIGLIKSKRIFLDFNDQYVMGQISLKPQFYLPSEDAFNRKNIKRKVNEYSHGNNDP